MASHSCFDDSDTNTNDTMQHLCAAFECQASLAAQPNVTSQIPKALCDFIQTNGQAYYTNAIHSLTKQQLHDYYQNITSLLAETTPQAFDNIINVCPQILETLHKTPPAPHELLKSIIMSKNAELLQHITTHHPDLLQAPMSRLAYPTSTSSTSPLDIITDYACTQDDIKFIIDYIGVSQALMSKLLHHAIKEMNVSYIEYLVRRGARLTL